MSRSIGVRVRGCALITLVIKGEGGGGQKLIFAIMGEGGGESQSKANG